MSDEYEFIARWGGYLGQTSETIHKNQEAARASGAPRTAIYRRTDPDVSFDDWATIDDLTNEHVIHALDLHYHTVETNTDAFCIRCGVSLEPGITKFCEGVRIP